VIVVDASVLAPVGADGTRYRLRLRGERLAGPDLLRVEVMSVIRRQLRAGTIDDTQAAAAIEDLVDLPLVVYATAPLLRRAWSLRDNVAAYDACYVVLAESLSCTLLTADARLSRSPGMNCPVEVL
jgi:predicted nucleic acid-binding protein